MLTKRTRTLFEGTNSIFSRNIHVPCLQKSRSSSILEFVRDIAYINLWYKFYKSLAKNVPGEHLQVPSKTKAYVVLLLYRSHIHRMFYRPFPNWYIPSFNEDSRCILHRWAILDNSILLINLWSRGTYICRFEGKLLLYLMQLDYIVAKNKINDHQTIQIFSNYRSPNHVTEMQ